MDETDNRKESDGKSLFIIRDGRKVASFEAGKWVPLLPGVVVRNTQDGIKIEGPQRPALCFPLTPHPRDVVADRPSQPVDRAKFSKTTCAGVPPGVAECPDQGQNSPAAISGLVGLCPGRLRVPPMRGRLTAGEFIDTYRRAHPKDVQQRMRERDARLAADTRTDVEKFLGDPPPGRSALARTQRGSPPRRGKAWRVDLWGKNTR